ncbi:MAG: S41 family peptidase, partial [Patescibacteria group bacterium]
DIDRGTAGISLPEAVQAIRGRAGTTVTLTLLREGEVEPIVVDIVRQELNVPTLILTYVGEGGSVAHIKLLKFGGETDEEWNKTIQEIIKKKEVKAIILDLRNNPGGY